jgi:uncharacterized membrane protein (UPF0127 family)
MTLCLIVASFGAAQELNDAFTRDAIVITASSGECYHFDVYLALTGEQQRRGLMFVRDLPAFTGMLFVYDDAGLRSMWMKNTFIPLDILFIREDGAVSSIARQTEPQSLRSIASIEAVTYVLELNAGVTESLGIDEQSRILLPTMLSVDG